MSSDQEPVAPEITVSSNGILNVRESKPLFEANGAPAGLQYYRYPLEPGADLTGKHARIVAIANAAWTPDVLAAYAEKKRVQDAEGE